MKTEWFAGRLREFREEKGWTQQELADSAGMKLGGVRDIEQGRRFPSWESVLSLCRALGVMPNEFTTEPSDAPKPKRGRPKKTVEPKPTPKRKRGRPRKGT